LNTRTKIFLLFICLFADWLAAQTKPFKDKNHWGIKEKETIVIPAVYDTIFNFDESGKVCLACFKIKSASSNKIIKTSSYTYVCNYLNRNQHKLRIKTEENDTCTVFSLNKTTVKQYIDDTQPFTVSSKGKKYLVGKDFKQLTFTGYYNVSNTLDHYLYTIQQMDESETVLTGVINAQEKEVIPCKYSHIRVNPVDSFIMACTAGVRINGDDDIYNYAGKKVGSYHRHIEMATKNFIIHKVFEPKEHFVIHNIKAKTDKNLQASEVHFYENDQILIRIKDDWYVYDLTTDQKKAKEY